MSSPLSSGEYSSGRSGSSSPLSAASHPRSVAATPGKDWSPRTGMTVVLPPGRSSLPASTGVSPSWSPAPGSLLLGETPPESPRLEDEGDFLDEEMENYSKLVATCTVNPRYYFDDEMSYFKVENQKFKVHRHFLVRDSVYFQELFAGPLGNFGVEESEAIPLEGIGSDEFECLLDFFYNGMYGHLGTTLSQWIILLSVATRFQFALLRALSIKSIEESPTSLDAIDKLVLAIKYNIPGWLAPAYTALCQRPNCLEEWEAEKIGLKRTVQIARAREAFRDGVRGSGMSPPRAMSPPMMSPGLYWNMKAPAMSMSMMQSRAASPAMDLDAARAARIVDEVFFSV
ncbi:hypothetical protein FB45DRAFT_796543 [Roridomyces roridus]|uniref:BTB domain-containing protein n=1 Tax=Roridomyces roridus TaxID=1738132 RepID=A0AAD7BLC7_9AGAR|nr:hypothetical protein FB45DRAFT_796543 [Roridomyces roridus]